MASEILVDKIDPQSGTSLELGSSGDTISVNASATTNLAGNVTLGASGKTITIPSGATITNNGTQTGFGGNVQPYASVWLSTSQSISDATYTVVGFDSVILNVGSCMDVTTNKGRFTPDVAGVYFISGYVQPNNNTASSQRNQTLKFSKNGSTAIDGANAKPGFYMELATTQASQYGFGISGGGVFDMNGSSDYLEVLGRFDVSSGTTGFMGNGYCTCNVFKLITT